MTSGLLAVGYFLFSILFSLITFVLWIRIALRYVHVSALHPMSQSIYQLTTPLVTPFSKLINKLNLEQAKRGRYDWVCFITLMVVELIKFSLLSLIFFSGVMPFGFVFVYALADLIIQPLNLMFYAIVIRVILSWVNPTWQTPIVELIYLITNPILLAARRITPIISGLDFAPLVAIIFIKIITLFIDSVLPLHFT